MQTGPFCFYFCWNSGRIYFLEFLSWRNGFKMTDQRVHSSAVTKKNFLMANIKVAAAVLRLRIPQLVPPVPVTWQANTALPSQPYRVSNDYLNIALVILLSLTTNHVINFPTAMKGSLLWPGLLVGALTNGEICHHGQKLSWRWHCERVDAFNTGSINIASVHRIFNNSVGNS